MENESINKHTAVNLTNNETLTVNESTEEIFHIIWSNITNNAKFVRLTQVITLIDFTHKSGVKTTEKCIFINIDHIITFYIK